MPNHLGSAIVSLLISVVGIAAGQIMKVDLASSRLGTIIAGGLGSLVFVFLLTAISNLQMASAGTQTKSGLTEVIVALIVSLIVSASIHRVALTVCLLFSMFFLFLLTGISQSKYATTAAQQTVTITKKKK